MRNKEEGGEAIFEKVTADKIVHYSLKHEPLESGITINPKQDKLREKTYNFNYTTAYSYRMRKLRT